MQLAQRRRGRRGARRPRGRGRSRYARRHGAGLFGRDQFATIDAIAAEEINLADELRDALAGARPRRRSSSCSPRSAVFWTIRGEHARLIALPARSPTRCAGWQPPPELEDTARAALVIDADQRDGHGRRAQRADPRAAARGWGRAAATRGSPGWSRCCSSTTRRTGERSPRGSSELADDPDPARGAGCACSGSATCRENAGDPEGAIEAAERALALVRETTGRGGGDAARPAGRLHDAAGDPGGAVRARGAAMPVLERLGRRTTVSSCCWRWRGS